MDHGRTTPSFGPKYHMSQVSKVSFDGFACAWRIYRPSCVYRGSLAAAVSSCVPIPIRWYPINIQDSGFLSRNRSNGISKVVWSIELAGPDLWFSGSDYPRIHVPEKAVVPWNPKTDHPPIITEILITPLVVLRNFYALLLPIELDVRRLEYRKARLASGLISADVSECYGGFPRRIVFWFSSLIL